MAIVDRNDESLIKKVVYEYPIFEDMIEPKGALSINRECHACFYYTMVWQRAFCWTIAMFVSRLPTP